MGKLQKRHIISFDADNMEVDEASLLSNTVVLVDSGKILVPIKDVFKNRRTDIKVFKNEKPEVYKVLRFILGSDAKVMKTQADTIEIKLHVLNDEVNLTKDARVKLCTWKKYQIRSIFQGKLW